MLLQTQYTDRFFQLCRLEGGFCMMSASLLIRLDEAGAETSRQSLDAKDGWSFAAIQEADGVLYVLTRNFYGEERRSAQIRAGYAFCAGGRYLHLGGHRAWRARTDGC